MQLYQFLNRALTFLEKAKCLVKLAVGAANLDLFDDWQPLLINTHMKCLEWIFTDSSFSVECGSWFSTRRNDCHIPLKSCYFKPLFCLGSLIPVAKARLYYQKASQFCITGPTLEKFSHCASLNLPCAFVITIQGCCLAIILVFGTLSIWLVAF